MLKSVRLKLPTKAGLAFSKSYGNHRDEFLVGFKVSPGDVQAPEGYSLCNENGNVSEDTIKEVTAQKTETFWFFHSTKRTSYYLGRGVPEDAGDYDGDGSSEFIFYVPADYITSSNVGNLLVYASDFSHFIDFQIYAK
jgi:hypothetical protein